jgi:hypothetical protein
MGRNTLTLTLSLRERGGKIEEKMSPGLARIAFCFKNFI